LNEETGLAGLPARQFRAYGDPGRDPRGHTVTVVFLVTCASCFPVRGQDDAARAEWFPLDALPPLAFDHSRILADVQSYLAGVGWPARPSLDDRVHRTEQNPRSR
jgi:8-oxo-dGTP diphosphatase